MSQTGVVLVTETFDTRAECKEAIASQAAAGDGYSWQCWREGGGFELNLVQDYNGPGGMVEFETASGGSGGIGALFAIGILISLAVVVWKVTTARRLARESGMDENVATGMTLLTDHGLEATYLASSLRGRPMAGPVEPPAPPAAGGETVRKRLAVLEQLRSDGSITEAEYAERRAAILAAL